MKCGSFDVADFLIDSGADVNYMEAGSANEWRAPVLHDAVKAAIVTDELERGRTILSKVLVRTANGWTLTL